MKNTNCPVASTKQINQAVSKITNSLIGGYQVKSGINDKKLSTLQHLYEMNTLTARQIQILVYRHNAMTTVYSALQALIRKKLIGYHVYGKVETWERFYFLTKKGWETVCKSMKVETSDTNYRRYQEPFKNAYYYHRKKLLDFWVVLLMECRKPDSPYSLISFIPEWQKLRGQPVVLRFDSFDEREASLKPDATFVLRNKATGKRLLYFLEIDTGTESVFSENYPSVIMKINCYYRAFHQGVFRHLSPQFKDFKGARMLFITSSKIRLQNIMADLKLDEAFRDAFLFSVHYEIWRRGVINGRYWKSGFESEVSVNSNPTQLATNIATI